MYIFVSFSSVLGVLFTIHKLAIAYRFYKLRLGNIFRSSGQMHLEGKVLEEKIIHFCSKESENLLSEHFLLF